MELESIEIEDEERHRKLTDLFDLQLDQNRPYAHAVLSAKQLRKILQREENYYDD